MTSRVGDPLLAHGRIEVVAREDRIRDPGEHHLDGATFGRPTAGRPSLLRCRGVEAMKEGWHPARQRHCKAVAAGATAAMAGRLYRYALSAAAERGVDRIRFEETARAVE